MRSEREKGHHLLSIWPVQRRVLSALCCLSIPVPYDCSMGLIVVLYHSFRYDAASKGFAHVVTIKSVLKHFAEPRHSLNCNCFGGRGHLSYKMSHTVRLTPIALLHPTKIKTNKRSNTNKWCHPGRSLFPLCFQEWYTIFKEGCCCLLPSTMPKIRRN